MTTGFDLDEIERLLAAATPVTSSDIMEYEHGGGRLAVISESERTLVADFYGDGADRDCFMAIRLAAPTILTEIRKLRATVATLGDSARAGANVLDVKDAEIRELRAENARLREAVKRNSCDCDVRCSLMEWLPADNTLCSHSIATKALKGPSHDA